ncbi:flippase [Alphaproteobacteria bacterium]|nr:flippase [Alphaproteobacteria bacterium]
MNNKSITKNSSKFNIYSNLLVIAKDSVIYGGAELITKLIGFIAYPILAVVLLPEGFGTLELIVTSTALIGLVMCCGLNNSVHRFYWDKETKDSDRATLVSSGLAVMIFFGLLTLLLCSTMIPMLSKQAGNYSLSITWIALISALFMMVFSQWLQYFLDVIRLHFAPWRFFSLSLITRVLGISLGVIVVVWLKWGIDGFLLVQALSALVALPLGFWLVRKDLTFHVSLSWIKKLIIFGYPFIFAEIAFWIFGSMDRWMIASITTIEETGIYSVSFRFVSIVLFVSMAFGQAWSPYAMKIKTESPNTYREVYVHVLLLLLFIMLSIGGSLALFSREIIGLIMPIEYQGSAIPLAILCFGIILQSTTQITGIGISLEKKTFLFARLAWLTAIVNLVLNFILIPLYGAEGAAWATTASYFVLTGSYLLFSQRLHPLPMPWKKLFIFLLIGTILLLFSVFENTIVLSINLIIIKLFVIIISMGLLWKFVLIEK